MLSHLKAGYISAAPRLPAIFDRTGILGYVFPEG